MRSGAGRVTHALRIACDEGFEYALGVAFHDSTEADVERLLGLCTGGTTIDI